MISSSVASEMSKSAGSVVPTQCREFDAVPVRVLEGQHPQNAEIGDRTVSHPPSCQLIPSPLESLRVSYLSAK
jgi:hypothetical protein